MKPKFLTVYRITAALLCAAGLAGAFTVFPTGQQVCLFANWSCLLSLCVWICLLCRPAGFEKLQGMATMCGLLTMVIFRFVLPLYTAMARNDEQRLVDFLLRTLIPLLMLGDFLLFRPRKALPKRAPLLWSIFPAIWFFAALLLPVLKENVWQSLPAYPYFFLNPNGSWILRAKQGMTGVWINACAILAVYILCGYMLRGAYMRRACGLSVYRLLAAMLCLYGQLATFELLDYRPSVNWDALCYFTNLSNLLCLATWLLLLWKPNGFARLHGMAAQAILLTMVVYHSLLSGFDFRINSVGQFNDHVVHTFVPLLMIADFLFLRKREKLRGYSPLIWVLAPTGYLGFVLLMPALERNFFPGMTRYPYFFMNPASGWLLPVPQGTAGVVLNCFVIAVVYIAAGYGMYGVYTWMCRKRT